MTRKEEIATIKRCEKAIYDRRRYLLAKDVIIWSRRYLLAKDVIIWSTNSSIGCLRRKRKRLERKLK